MSNDPDLLLPPQAQVADIEAGRLFVVPSRNVLHLAGARRGTRSAGAALPPRPLCRRQRRPGFHKLMFVENMRRVSTVLSTGGHRPQRPSR